jgi:hypothetical protein
VKGMWEKNLKITSLHEENYTFYATIKYPHTTA